MLYSVMEADESRFLAVLLCVLLRLNWVTTEVPAAANHEEDNDYSVSFSYSSEPWILHDVTSPVFLRYFDTPVSWLSAEEVCQTHFGHLVRDGNGNEASVHDFLTARDIHTEVWIGLYQNSPADRFHWVDDPSSRVRHSGLFSSRLEGGIPTEEPELGMCVSVDPKAGYRWNTRYCNGPEKATFVCQVPVPVWLKEGRCNLAAWAEEMRYGKPLSTGETGPEVMKREGRGDVQLRVCSFEDYVFQNDEAESSQDQATGTRNVIKPSLDWDQFCGPEPSEELGLEQPSRAENEDKFQAAEAENEASDGDEAEEDLSDEAWTDQELFSMASVGPQHPVSLVATSLTTNNETLEPHKRTTKLSGQYKDQQSLEQSNKGLYMPSRSGSNSPEQELLFLAADSESTQPTEMKREPRQVQKRANNANSSLHRTWRQWASTGALPPKVANKLPSRASSVSRKRPLKTLPTREPPSQQQPQGPQKDRNVLAEY